MLQLIYGSFPLGQKKIWGLFKSRKCLGLFKIHRQKISNTTDVNLPLINLSKLNNETLDYLFEVVKVSHLCFDHTQLKLSLLKS